MAPAGRPKSNNPKYIRFSIRLDDITHQKLEIYCNKHCVTKGEAVRRAIEIIVEDKVEA